MPSNNSKYTQETRERQHPTCRRPGNPPPVSQKKWGSIPTPSASGSESIAGRMGCQVIPKRKA